MENATQSKTDSIKNIIDGIVKKDIVLPEFQRDFVWDIGKTYDLFDSLTKDVFIGSNIYGIPAVEVTVRELDDRPRQGEGSRRKLALKSYLKEEVDEKVQTGNFRLVLDGQQRLTSLYRTLKKNTEKAIKVGFKMCAIRFLSIRPIAGHVQKVYPSGDADKQDKNVSEKFFADG